MNENSPRVCEEECSVTAEKTFVGSDIRQIYSLPKRHKISGQNSAVTGDSGNTENVPVCSDVSTSVDLECLLARSRDTCKNTSINLHRLLEGCTNDDILQKSRVMRMRYVGELVRHGLRGVGGVIG